LVFTLKEELLFVVNIDRTQIPGGVICCSDIAGLEVHIHTGSELLTVVSQNMIVTDVVDGDVVTGCAGNDHPVLFQNPCGGAGFQAGNNEGGFLTVKFALYRSIFQIILRNVGYIQCCNADYIFIPAILYVKTVESTVLSKFKLGGFVIN